jgi:malate dehydrogenase
MKIGIIGAAGTVGSCTSYTIADRGLAHDLVLLDTNEDLLNSHVNDIKTAVSGRHDIVVHGGDYPDLRESDIIIIPAGKHLAGTVSMEERLRTNVPLMQKIGTNITEYCPGAIVITVTNPLDPLNYALYLAASLGRYQFIGYSLNDSIRFRMAVSGVLGISATRVEAYVLGRHPEAQVMLFSSIKIDGQKAGMEHALRQQIRDRAHSYLRALKSDGTGRTAGWTTAAGLAQIVAAISNDDQEVMPSSVIVDGEYGFTGMSIGLPAVIGRSGISRVPELELFAEEREDLSVVADDLQRDCRLAGNMLV